MCRAKAQVSALSLVGASRRHLKILQMLQQRRLSDIHTSAWFLRFLPSPQASMSTSARRLDPGQLGEVLQVKFEAGGLP